MKRIKKETFKELGKYFLDISKILLALAMVTPLLKDENISYIVIALFIILFIVGTYFTNKGAKDE